MIWLNKNYLKCLLILCLCVASPAWATANPLANYKGAEIHKTLSKTYDEYELYYGPMEYIENVDTTEEEGYMPRETIKLTGEAVKYVYDHRVKDSALEIAKSVRKILEKNGFTIEYYCEHDSCGYVDGWRLYLSEEIGGSDKDQYYLVGKSNGKYKSEEYIVLYVNDLDVRPRSVVHVITAAKNTDLISEPVVSSIDLAKELNSQGRAEISGIYFDFDSSVLKKESAPALKEVAKMLNEKNDIKLFVVGHSDSVGSIGYNLKLSKQRANAVIQHLVSNEGINKPRLQAYGIGPLSPVERKDQSITNAKNRRVEVVLQ